MFCIPTGWDRNEGPSRLVLQGARGVYMGVAKSAFYSEVSALEAATEFLSNVANAHFGCLGNVGRRL